MSCIPLGEIPHHSQVPRIHWVCRSSTLTPSQLASRGIRLPKSLETMTFGPIFHQSLRGFLMDQPKISELLGGFKQCLFPQPDWGYLGWWSNLTNSYFSRWLKPPSSHNVWQFWRKRWGKWGRSITLHPYDQKWLVAQGLLTQCCQLVKVEFVEPPSSLGLRQ